MRPSRRLGHRLDGTTEAEFIAQIPAHTEDDDLPVEMAALKVMFDMPGQFPHGQFAPEVAPPRALHQNL